LSFRIVACSILSLCCVATCSQPAPNDQPTPSDDLQHYIDAATNIDGFPDVDNLLDETPASLGKKEHSSVPPKPTLLVLKQVPVFSMNRAYRQSNPDLPALDIIPQIVIPDEPEEPLLIDIEHCLAPVETGVSTTRPDPSKAF